MAVSTNNPIPENGDRLTVGGDNGDLEPGPAVIVGALVVRVYAPALVVARDDELDGTDLTVDGGTREIFVKDIVSDFDKLILRYLRLLPGFSY